MFFGFALGKAITTLLLAKVFGFGISLTTLDIAACEADAKTSAGAPCLICSARVADPANEIVTFVPGFANSNLLEISVNVWVRLAAAKTVISVSEFDAGVCVALSVLIVQLVIANTHIVSATIFLTNTACN